MTGLDAYRQAVAKGGDGERVNRLFAAAWEQLENDYFERLAATTCEAGGWRERFRAGATLTVGLVEQHPRETSFLVVDALGAGTVGRIHRLRFSTRLADMIDTAREDLDDPDSVPPTTAAWIVGVFFDKIYRRCTNGSGADLRLHLPELLFLGVSAYFGTEAGMEELF